MRTHVSKNEARPENFEGKRKKVTFLGEILSEQTIGIHI